MSKFIFENADKLKFSELCGADMKAVAATINTNECESFDVCGWVRTSNEVFIAGVVGVDSVYRVLAKPYTLEGAITKMNSLAVHVDDGEFIGYYVDISEALVVIGELAESLGGDK